MPITIKTCSECGTTCPHNPLPKTKDGGGGYRCTFCGYPLGTGPKRDKNMNTHLAQVAKARLKKF